MSISSPRNFNDNKRARKASAKKLFDNQSQHSPESMTQLLGFCSGHFGSGTSEAETEKNEEKSEEPAVIKDSGFFDLVDCENEIENAMYFCSGKPSDFKTQHSELYSLLNFLRMSLCIKEKLIVSQLILIGFSSSSTNRNKLVTKTN